MKIVVVRARCAGNAVCEGLDPERFQVQVDGRAQVLRMDLGDEEQWGVVQEAVKSCPERALRITF